MFEWNDPRLKHEHGTHRSAIVIDDPAFMDEIWLPDIFVVNAKKVSEDALKHIEIYENGDVRYMLRYKTLFVLTFIRSFVFHIIIYIKPFPKAGVHFRAKRAKDFFSIVFAWRKDYVIKKFRVNKKK